MAMMAQAGGTTGPPRGPQPGLQQAKRKFPHPRAGSLLPAIRSRLCSLPWESSSRPISRDVCNGKAPGTLPMPGHLAMRRPRDRRSVAARSQSETGNTNAERGKEETKTKMTALRDHVTEICLTARDLLKSCLRLLGAAFLPIFLIHEVCALFTFAAQRASHRFLNEVAAKGLGIPESSMGDMWTLADLPEIMNFDTGYQQLSFVFYLLLIPATALLRSFASTATFIICRDTMQRGLSAKAADVPAQGTQAEEAYKAASEAGSKSEPSAKAADVPSHGSQAGEADKTNSEADSKSEPSAKAADVPAQGTKAGEADKTPTEADSKSEPSAKAASEAESKSEPSAKAADAPAQATQAGEADKTPTEADSKPEKKEAETENKPDSADKSESSSPGLWSRIRSGVAKVFQVQPRVREVWVTMWLIELLVTVRVMPLEALSYFVITLPWTLPRILNLQLAVVAAVQEKLTGMNALRRSAELAKGVKWGMLLLLIGTLMAARVVEGMQTASLGYLPTRFFRDVPEIPLLISVAAYVANRFVNRIRDIMPFAVYTLQTSRAENDSSNKPDKTVEA